MSFEDEFTQLCAKFSKDPQKILKQESDDSPFVPEEVKKVVVEHVIKEKTNPTVQRRKLRLFSGNQPTPNGEVNFATWRITAKQVIDDGVIDEKEKKRCLIDSLLCDATYFTKLSAGMSNESIRHRFFSFSSITLSSITCLAVIRHVAKLTSPFGVGWFPEKSLNFLL